MWDNKIQRVHCIGVGGIGVSALAEILHRQGFEVSGSDCNKSQTTARLSRLGVAVFDQHVAEQVNHADLVIYSSAINENNSELKQARARHIPCLKRGEVLAQLFNQKKGVVVVGSHGKTTTASMASTLLVEASFDPTCVVGGIVQGAESPVRFGQSHFFVTEGDESDGSFLLLKPNIAIVTNIDDDHLSHYGGEYESLLTAFQDFLNALPEDGLAILNIDDRGVKAILPYLRCPVLTYGVQSSADVRLLNHSQSGMLSCFDVNFRGDKISMEIQLPGLHNAINALAACALACHLDIQSDIFARALRQFPGVDRRVQCRGVISLQDGEAVVIEDYGHHPREIDVTLEAVRQAWPQRRLVLVFQPHRYSRTKELLSEFARVVSQADCVVLLDVYTAGETPGQGVDSSVLYSAIKELCHQDVSNIGSVESLPAFLASIIRAHDIILLQGAGSVGAQATLVIESIEQGCC